MTNYQGVGRTSEICCGYRVPRVRLLWLAAPVALRFCAAEHRAGTGLRRRSPCRTGLCRAHRQGVHAIQQVVHFDSPAQRSERAWMLGANCRLPRDIRIKWVVAVSDDFHARFGAQARAYRYLIFNEPVPSALFHDLSAWEYRKLDHGSMHEAAQCLLGEHDFSSFRAAGCQAKSASRNVQEISVSRQGDMVDAGCEGQCFPVPHGA